MKLQRSSKPISGAMDSCFDQQMLLPSVLRAIRDACQRRISFKKNISLTGFLCIDVDGDRQMHFVINEDIVRTDETDHSHSFCVKDIDTHCIQGISKEQPVGKAKPAEVSPAPILPETRIISSLQHLQSLPYPKRYSYGISAQSPGRDSPKTKTIRPSELQTENTFHQTKPILQTFHQQDEPSTTSSVTKPCPLSTFRNQKSNRTFTIEDENDNDSKSKETTPRKNIHSFRNHIKTSQRTFIQNPAKRKTTSYLFSDRNIESVANYKRSSLATSGGKSSHNCRVLRKKGPVSDISSCHFSADKDRENKTYLGNVDNDDSCSGSELNDLDTCNVFECFEGQDYMNESDIIAATKPPQGFEESDCEIFELPQRVESDSLASRKTYETLSTTDFEFGDKTPTSREEITELLNNVINVLSNTQRKSHSAPVEHHVSEFLSSPDSNWITVSDSVELSPLSDLLPQRENRDCGVNTLPLKQYDGWPLVNHSVGGAMPLTFASKELPTVKKKKGKRFQWMKIFKKDSSPRILCETVRHEDMAQDLHMTASHTSIASNWSKSSYNKHTMSPDTKKRRIGHRC